MSPAVSLDAYDFDLPAELIAQHPPAERDGGRLLVLDRATGERHHGAVRDLPRWLEPGDLLIVNATRVRPARLRGAKRSGGRAEALLLGPGSLPGTFRALLRCGGRQRPGIELRFSLGESGLDATVTTVREGGEVELRFDPEADPYAIGEAPLPPYIRREASEASDLERYQTVYAREPGAVAAPTAGLHLTPALLRALRDRGVAYAEVILHVGAGTFRPIDEKTLESGALHQESYRLPEATAEAIAETRARGGRVVAVGTTSARVLETRADGAGGATAGCGSTDLLLRPGSRFRVVDALLTNFHLPRSSLLLLVAALAGRDAVLDAYREAVVRGYRFYSYGDAMLVL